MSRYKIRYKKDETGLFVASVDGVSGCHTQGRTLEEAKGRIREALSLFVDDAETAELFHEPWHQSYQECVLRKGDAERTAWVPTNMVSKGAILRVNINGEWSDGWEIYTPRYAFTSKGTPGLCELMEE